MGWDSFGVVEALIFFAVVSAFFATVAFSAWCLLLIIAAYDLIREKMGK